MNNTISSSPFDVHVVINPITQKKERCFNRNLPVKLDCIEKDAEFIFNCLAQHFGFTLDKTFLEKISLTIRTILPQKNIEYRKNQIVKHWECRNKTIKVPFTVTFHCNERGDVQAFIKLSSVIELEPFTKTYKAALILKNHSQENFQFGVVNKWSINTSTKAGSQISKARIGRMDKLKEDPNVLPLLAWATGVRKKGGTKTVLYTPYYFGKLKDVLSPRIKKRKFNDTKKKQSQMSQAILELGKTLKELHENNLLLHDVVPNKRVICHAKQFKKEPIANLICHMLLGSNKHSLLQQLCRKFASFSPEMFLLEYGNPEDKKTLFEMWNVTDSNHLIGKHSDMWGLGCIIYAMHYNAMPKLCTLLQKLESEILLQSKLKRRYQEFTDTIDVSLSEVLPLDESNEFGRRSDYFFTKLSVIDPYLKTFNPTSSKTMDLTKEIKNSMNMIEKHKRKDVEKREEASESEESSESDKDAMNFKEEILMDIEKLIDFDESQVEGIEKSLDYTELDIIRLEKSIKIDGDHRCVNDRAAINKIPSVEDVNELLEMNRRLTLRNEGLENMNENLIAEIKKNENTIDSLVIQAMKEIKNSTKVPQSQGKVGFWESLISHLLCSDPNKRISADVLHLKIQQFKAEDELKAKRGSTMVKLAITKQKTDSKSKKSAGMGVTASGLNSARFVPVNPPPPIEALSASMPQVTEFFGKKKSNTESSQKSGNGS